MRKLLPFAGIAIAVALGIALAPFVWWAAGALLVCAAVCGVVLSWRRYRDHSAVVIGAGVVMLAVLLAWPIWLLWRGDPANALAALVIVLVVGFWQFIAAWIRPYWLKVFPD